MDLQPSPTLTLASLSQISPTCDTAPPRRAYTTWLDETKRMAFHPVPLRSVGNQVLEALGSFPPVLVHGGGRRVPSSRAHLFGRSRIHVPANCFSSLSPVPRRYIPRRARTSVVVSAPLEQQIRYLNTSQRSSVALLHDDSLIQLAGTASHRFFPPAGQQICPDHIGSASRLDEMLGCLTRSRRLTIQYRPHMFLLVCIACRMPTSL